MCCQSNQTASISLEYIKEEIHNHYVHLSEINFAKLSGFVYRYIFHSIYYQIYCNRQNYTYVDLNSLSQTKGNCSRNIELSDFQNSCSGIKLALIKPTLINDLNQKCF